MDRTFICNRCMYGNNCKDRSRLEEYIRRIDKMMHKAPKKFKFIPIINCDGYDPANGPRLMVKRG